MTKRLLVVAVCGAFFCLLTFAFRDEIASSLDRAVVFAGDVRDAARLNGVKWTCCELVRQGKAQVNELVDAVRQPGADREWEAEMRELGHLHDGLVIGAQANRESHGIGE